MIIIGYQGIGKTTLSNRNHNCIDLESSCMRVHETSKRPDNWYVYYCNFAEHLSQQGYTVFTSSHKEVRERLAKSNEEVAIIYPSIDMRDTWINKLYIRYNNSNLDKDFRAYANAKDRYEDNIRELQSDIAKYGFMHYEITSINYDLASCILAIRMGKTSFLTCKQIIEKLDALVAENPERADCGADVAIPTVPNSAYISGIVQYGKMLNNRIELSVDYNVPHEMTIGDIAKSLDQYAKNYDPSARLYTSFGTAVTDIKPVWITDKHETIVIYTERTTE